MRASTFRSLRAASSISWSSDPAYDRENDVDDPVRLAGVGVDVALGGDEEEEEEVRGFLTGDDDDEFSVVVNELVSKI